MEIYTNVNAEPSGSEDRVNCELTGPQRKDYEEITKQLGSLFEVKKTTIRANRPAIAKLFAKFLGRVIYVGTEDRLYRKDESRGLWESIPEDLLCTEVLESLIKFAKQELDLDVGHLCTLSFAREILRLVKLNCRDDTFFKRPPDKFILHLLNCFLVIDAKDGSMDIKPLETEDIHSRCQLNVRYEPDAACPRFLNELLEPVLNKDEIEFVLQYCGQCLIGENISEKILFLIGLAGGGKSTLVNVIELLIGRENVTELRTQCLYGGHETSRYIGKNLLCGKDVPADFLMKQGASKLKALTGKDVLTTELKHSNAVGSIVGNFNVIITSNCSQPVLLQNDEDAWRRRVLCVRFKNTKPANPIRDFDRVLVEEEGPGILNEVLKRLIEVLKNGGQIKPGESQLRAIEAFIEESKSVETFLKRKVEAVEAPTGSTERQIKQNLTSEELYTSYLQFCKAQAWTPIPTRKFQVELTDLMPQLFGCYRRNDIEREGTCHRGYYAVQFKATTKEAN